MIEEAKRAGRSKAVWTLPALGIVGAVVYLATRGSPYLAEVPWLPDWLGAWADRHGNLRNLPAFFALGVVLVGLCGRRRAMGLGCGLGIGLELAQLFIAGRQFSWADIFWSCTGVFLAAALAGASAWLVRRRKKSAVGAG